MLIGKELAERLNIDVKWLYRNRQRKENKIPYYKIGRKPCYEYETLRNWLGYDEINLLKSEQVANLLGCSVAWLKQNRASMKSIPFLKLGRLVRYHPQALRDWLHEQNK